VYVPASDKNDVTESGNAADKSSGVQFQRMEKNAAVFAVGSGVYNFKSAVPET
jgi:hypothetical protein